MAQYVLYPSKSSARFRRWFLTGDARLANFIGPEEDYFEVINHPTEDKAAIEVVMLPSIYIDGLPTPKYDFSIFFTAQELARVVSDLPADWYPEILL